MNPEGKEEKEYVDWLRAKVLQKAVVVDDGGNMLVLKRTSHGPASRPDKWDLPGGSVSLEDLVGGVGVIKRAIAREVLEEAGLEVKNVTSVHTTSWTFEKSVGVVLGLAIGYHCTVSGARPEVVLGDEHCEFKWVSKEELLELDFGEDGGLHKDIVSKVG